MKTSYQKSEDLYSLQCIIGAPYTFLILIWDQSQEIILNSGNNPLKLTFMGLVR